jgi:prepilin-type N-terminal cleavage/methylation domain-containing protein
MRSRSLPAPRPRTAFTLVELLAAIGILSVLMVVIFSVYNHASRAWLVGENRAETFQGARLVLETMARELEGAVASSSAVSGATITFVSKSDAVTLPCTTAGGSLAATPPNDALFFVGCAPDSPSQQYLDLTEYGYFVAFAAANYSTMQAGHYYLLRHQVRSHYPSGAANSNWDIFDYHSTWGNLANWYMTPNEITTSNRVPILENVLRLEFRFEGRNDPVLTNGTSITTAWNNTDAADGCSTQPSLLTPAVLDPELRLPRAVHIRLAMVDRRTADRLAAILGNTVMTQSDLGKLIPNCTGENLIASTLANPAAQNVLRENLRVFYKSVFLRNSAP